MLTQYTHKAGQLGQVQGRQVPCLNRCSYQQKADRADILLSPSEIN